MSCCASVYCRCTLLTPARCHRRCSLVLEDLARGVASEELVQRLVRGLPGLQQLRLRRCVGLGEAWAQRLSTTLRRPRLQLEFVAAPAGR
jgi:hypothetical protein